MKIDPQWASEQLAKARVRVDVASSVMSLLEAWSKASLPLESADQALTAFSSLARGHALVHEDSGEETWVQAMPGYLVVGDEVRVKVDAYTGNTGVLHNGRRGRIVGIRYGDIIVNTTDDREPQLVGSHHSPYALEKRVL